MVALCSANSRRLALRELSAGAYGSCLLANFSWSTRRVQAGHDLFADPGPEARLSKER